MFELSWGEILLIGIVALVVIGPKELPGVLRAVGQGIGKLRRMAGDFQYQFQQALQEAEVDQVKSTVDGLNDTVKSGFDPMGMARDQLKSVLDDVKSAAAPPADPIGPPVEINVPPVAAAEISNETLMQDLATAAVAEEPVVAEEPAKKPKRPRKTKTPDGEEGAA